MPFTANFTGNVLNPTYQYSWSFGDGSTGDGPNPSHEYNSPGTYAVQLIASNNTGCIDTVNAIVEAYPVPVAEFNLYHGTGTYYANISTMTLENLSAGGTSYFWTFGDGANSTEFEPDYQFTEPGLYTIGLTVMNQYGCRDDAATQLDVKLPENIYVPNAFTPNGDNVNDNFSVASYNIEDFRINIFNRWGHLIYTSTDPYFQWDGSYNGVKVSNGVYVFSVDAKGMFGTNFNLTGTVTVLK
jgi:gliding motility-associated-like protein